MATLEVKVPDIGDFKDVPIIQVFVKPGDSVNPEDPLITLESDKATMDVPSPARGTVKEVQVKVGDRVGEGRVILVLETEEERREPSPAPTPSGAGDNASRPAAAPSATAPARDQAPARAPSRVQVDRVIDEVEEIGHFGVRFGDGKPSVDTDKLRGWKETVVKKLTGGLGAMAKQRKVAVITGVAQFADPHHVEISGPDGKKQVVRFDQCIIAAGSQAAKLPFLPNDPRIIDSTGALELEGVPGRLLVVGGGIIGMEMAQVYASLGSRMTVVELLPQLMTGADPDLVRPLARRVSKRYEAILLETKVVRAEAAKEGILVWFEGKNAPSEPQTYDRVLVAVGRTPNGKRLAAEKAGMNVTDHGFIPVDEQQRTNVPHIFAIGDVVGQPMLAHKASHEGHVAAEAASGMKSYFDARVIPSVAYTDPEVAWVGVTEEEAKANGIKYGKGTFPWGASGRALSLGRDDGLTKLLFDEENHR